MNGTYVSDLVNDLFNIQTTIYFTDILIPIGRNNYDSIPEDLLEKIKNAGYHIKEINTDDTCSSSIIFNECFTLKEFLDSLMIKESKVLNSFDLANNKNKLINDIKNRVYELVICDDKESVTVVKNKKN